VARVAQPEAEAGEFAPFGGAISVGEAGEAEHAPVWQTEVLGLGTGVVSECEAAPAQASAFGVIAGVGTDGLGEIVEAESGLAILVGGARNQWEGLFSGPGILVGGTPAIAREAPSGVGVGGGAGEVEQPNNKEAKAGPYSHGEQVLFAGRIHGVDPACLPMRPATERIYHNGTADRNVLEQGGMPVGAIAEAREISCALDNGKSLAENS